MKTKTPPIAIVTPSREAYERHIALKGISPNEAKQVAVLNHVKDEVFSDVTFIEGSDNVCDYVKNRIKLINDEG